MAFDAIPVRVHATDWKGEGNRTFYTGWADRKNEGNGAPLPPRSFRTNRELSGRLTANYSLQCFPRIMIPTILESQRPSCPHNGRCALPHPVGQPVEQAFRCLSAIALTEATAGGAFTVKRNYMLSRSPPGASHYSREVRSRRSELGLLHFDRCPAPAKLYIRRNHLLFESDDEEL
ncbi:hypothetical protein M427DRAFT_53749 [Gonapodya prolifera JEL478]|uniref:Uncharacterized protein n=1 Tax=Gonapodya prolifera (strain JEL478) TaxID=1344416 RepID=A0A139APE0_GONPJ|nr:hypothetical protein M427DRAFT_53749 [Gonapodya prolifera JEL478]|eukprot:KXS18355.1 hypothetical protein M427DRAFT_53749 [Gonapodya prolifera JEL478]